jgi:hypothetical protein
MAWIRPLVLILTTLWVLVVLFSRDDSGRREVSHLFHFSPSNMGSIVNVSTPLVCLWQLVGVGLVLMLHRSAWNLVWWLPLGFITLFIVSKLLMRRLKA